MPDILAIETSSEACSVAVFVGGEIRERHVHAPLRHAELLLPAVSGLLDEAGRSLSSLDLIAFGRGPGSFTSLRIGIGVVQGLAWGAGLPVVPVSSLAAVAQAAADQSTVAFSSVCVATDARMDEVYTANFAREDSGQLVLSGTERVCAPADVAAPAAGPFIAAGNGFERFEELIALAAGAADRIADLQPRAETVCRLALEWLSRNEPLTAALAQPVYIRNDVAEKPASQES